MTVRELVAILSELPQDEDVYIHNKPDWALCEIVRVREAQGMIGEAVYPHQRFVVVEIGRGTLVEQ